MSSYKPEVGYEEYVKYIEENGWKDFSLISPNSNLAGGKFYGFQDIESRVVFLTGVDYENSQHIMEISKLLGLQFYYIHEDYIPRNFYGNLINFKNELSHEEGLGATGSTKDHVWLKNKEGWSEVSVILYLPGREFFSNHTLLHETLHAFGLHHTGPFNGATTSETEKFPFDDVYLSVMSYKFAFQDPTSTSLPPADLEALWRKYNHVPDYINGGMDMYDLEGVHGHHNIVDTGGIDRILLGDADSGQSGDLVGHEVDMRMGGLSKLYYNNQRYYMTIMDMVHNDDGEMVFAGSVVEELFSGSGNDLIYANSANNVIDAGGGNDTIYGHGGNDAIYGGDGHDLIDTLAESGIEIFTADLYGGAGNDTIIGARGTNTISGNTGEDRIWGHDAADVLYGHEDNDILYGEGGNDWLYGGQGADQVYGGRGDDQIEGGSENDGLHGSEGADSISGGDGNDSLFGGAGVDVLDGGWDDDVLDGGIGNDLLMGGGGRDIFVFRLGDGHDTITDFAIGEDRIRVEQDTPLPSLIQVGNHLVLSADTTTLTLEWKFWDPALYDETILWA